MNAPAYPDPYAAAPDLAAEVRALARLTVEHAALRRGHRHIPPADRQHLALRQAALLDRSALADPDDHLAAAAALHAALAYQELTTWDGSPLATVREDYQRFRDDQRLPIGAPVVSRQLAEAGFTRARTVYGDSAGLLAPRRAGFIARARLRAVEVDHLGGSEAERAVHRGELARYLRDKHGYTVVETPLHGSVVLRVTRYPDTTEEGSL